MIEIKKVEENSIAEDIGLTPGDSIISINGQEINDFLDLHYYEGDENIVIVFRKSGENYEIEIDKESGHALGITPAHDDMRTCTNNCIFCFIKQNPPGMRKQIYVCDGDYRYSFLQGNFVTMTNADQDDLNRIVNQRLAPLYISVHATDPAARRELFRVDEEIPILKKLEYLAKNDIEMHAQIVLVPEVNDGEILDKTIRDLYKFKNAIRSVAIVPVGLTKHREKLPNIKSVDSELASEIIRKNENWERIYRNNDGAAFVYLADEIYLLAGQDLPISEHYAEFYQIENGVGLSRKWIDDLVNDIRHFDGKLQKKTTILLVSGELGARVLKKYIAPYLKQVDNLIFDILPVKNKFFGESVTVSGLLTGQDILSRVESLEKNYDAVFLPPRCVNHNGILLDNKKPEELSKTTGTEFVISSKNMMEKIKNVKN